MSTAARAWAGPFGQQQTADLVIQALNMALITRKPQGVIHHSEQGSQYNSVDFGKRCKEMGVRQSMGSEGDACDNAMAVFTWIEGWYNPRLRHKGLGQKSTINFEKELHNIGDAAAPAIADLTSTSELKSSPTVSVKLRSVHLD